MSVTHGAALRWPSRLMARFPLLVVYPLNPDLDGFSVSFVFYFSLSDNFLSTCITILVFP